MFDIIIKSGSYPNYQAQEMIKADIGIKDGKIAKIGCISESAETVIDAAGKIVAPGFIDIHMHEEDFAREGEKYIISEMMLRMGVTTCLGGNCGVQYQNLKAFKETISGLGGAPVNYLMLVGYNSHRSKAGINKYEKADEEQQKLLLMQMRKELEEGAFGFSFGIEYDPGMDTEEIMNILGNIDDSNLFVSAHYRWDSVRAIDSITEMIQIADQSNMKFQISHLSSCAAMGQMKSVLDLLNQEIMRNPKINYDTYPYHAFSTHIGSAVFDEGCFENWGKSYDKILITDGKYKNQFCNKERFEEIRKETPQMLVVAFVMNEDEIAEAIANPHGMIASDGIINNGNGHPRAAGAFPRVLGKYVREDKVISLMDALRKMTIEPAKRLDLQSKGQIIEGGDADITIFDPDTIQDGADFTELKPPVGIDYVIVNGKIAVDHNHIVNGKAGRFISYQSFF
ncbi:amidohydrolase family protein [Anoxybacterium hadale]|uniref:Amidohydrolase family protein n=1 Tax=Anoxybacterium hadale TaxID=3408580 RepID=A0ACD1A9T8_9FIRM|nr:amidohydrolase family protein [Clostridiales bacterium]